MSTIRADLRSEFKGEQTVVLLAMDEAGLDTLRGGITTALVAEGGASQLVAAATTHDLRVESGTAGLTLGMARVTWKMSPAKFDEILLKLEAI